MATAANTVGCTEAVVARILHSLGCVSPRFAACKENSNSLAVAFSRQAVSIAQAITKWCADLQIRWRQPHPSYGGEQDVETHRS